METWLCNSVVQENLLLFVVSGLFKFFCLGLLLSMVLAQESCASSEGQKCNKEPTSCSRIVLVAMSSKISTCLIRIIKLKVCFMVTVLRRVHFGVKCYLFMAFVWKVWGFSFLKLCNPVSSDFFL